MFTKRTHSYKKSHFGNFSQILMMCFLVVRIRIFQKLRGNLQVFFSSSQHKLEDFFLGAQGWHLTRGGEVM